MMDHAPNTAYRFRFVFIVGWLLMTLIYISWIIVPIWDLFFSLGSWPYYILPTVALDLSGYGLQWLQPHIGLDGVLEFYSTHPLTYIAAAVLCGLPHVWWARLRD